MLSRLGMMLMESGLVTSDEINQIVTEYGPGEIELADQLVSMGIVPEDLITEYLSEIYSVKPVFLNEMELDPAGIPVNHAAEMITQLSLEVPDGENQIQFKKSMLATLNKIRS